MKHLELDVSNRASSCRALWNAFTVNCTKKKNHISKQDNKCIPFFLCHRAYIKYISSHFFLIPPFFFSVSHFKYRQICANEIEHESGTSQRTIEAT